MKKVQKQRARSYRNISRRLLTPVQIAKELTPYEYMKLCEMVGQQWRQSFGVLRVRRIPKKVIIAIELEGGTRHHVKLLEGNSPETQEARVLANVLLQHRRHLRTDLHLTSDSISPQHMLPYGELCIKANLEHLTRTVGHFLGQVAEWCHQSGLPPLNSLAVNEYTRVPGEGYDNAFGCSLAHWWDEVRACVDCEDYPIQT